VLARAQDHASVLRQQLPHARELGAQRVAQEGNGLVQQFRDFFAHQGAPAKIKISF
jgi:hypothetical protein